MPKAIQIGAAPKLNVVIKSKKTIANRKLFLSSTRRKRANIKKVNIKRVKRINIKRANVKRVKRINIKGKRVKRKKIVKGKKL